MSPLTNNEKITLAISIIALVVSGISAYFVYLQMESAKAEHMPIFHFKINMTYNPEKHYFTHDELIISNLGESITDFDGEKREFLLINYANCSDLKWKSKKIVLYDYYLLRFPTSLPKGELMTLSYPINEEGNNWYVTNFIREFPTVAAKQHLLAFVDLNRVFKLTYKDLYGQPHEQYFLVDQYGGREIDSITGKQLLDSDPTLLTSVKALNSTLILDYLPIE